MSATYGRSPAMVALDALRELSPDGKSIKVSSEFLQNYRELNGHAMFMGRELIAEVPND